MRTALLGVLGTALAQLPGKPLPDAPLRNFQVQEPLGVPHGVKTCNLQLVRHLFANSYGQPAIVQYAPPEGCGDAGSWSRVVANFTATSNGTQFDRLANVYLHDVEIWRTSTPEPTAKGIIWTALKDVTHYRALLASPGNLTIGLGNLLDSSSGLTGEYDVTLSAIFYSHSHTPVPSLDTSDVILPISTAAGQAAHFPDALVLDLAAQQPLCRSMRAETQAKSSGLYGNAHVPGALVVIASMCPGVTYLGLSVNCNQPRGCEIGATTILFPSCTCFSNFLNEEKTSCSRASTPYMFLWDGEQRDSHGKRRLSSHKRFPSLRGGTPRPCTMTPVKLTIWTFATNDTLTLELPIAILITLTTNPIKWLHYVAYCILFVDGHVSNTPGGGPINVPQDVHPGDQFYYVMTNPDSTLDRAVRPGAIKRKGESSDTSLGRSTTFKEMLVERDGECVFTGATVPGCHGCHFIPYYIEAIMSGRGSNINDIDAIENGLLMYSHANSLLDERDIAIIKTPNHILEIDDVPPEQNPCQLRPGQQRPPCARYTLQHISAKYNNDPVVRVLFPHNRDAQFRRVDRLPSEEILDYVYGASMLQQFVVGDLTTFATRPDQPQSQSLDMYERPLHDYRTAGPSRSARERDSDDHEGGSGTTEMDAFELCLAFRLASPQYTRHCIEEQRQLNARVASWLQTV